MRMVAPSFFALTSTPSIGPSSAEVTCPASAAAPCVSAGEEWELTENKMTAKLAVTVSNSFFDSMEASSNADVLDSTGAYPLNAFTGNYSDVFLHILEPKC